MNIDELSQILSHDAQIKYGVDLGKYVRLK